MTSKERILSRLKTIALIATSDNMDEQLTSLRTMTRIFLNTIGAARGEMLAGCYGCDIIQEESLPAIMHEQIAIAKQAIVAAAFTIRLVRGDAEAQQYTQQELAELEAFTTEDLMEYHARLQGQAEESAQEEAKDLGREAVRTALIDEMFAVAHRGN